MSIVATIASMFTVALSVSFAVWMVTQVIKSK
jgi:hypothetical protein